MNLKLVEYLFNEINLIAEAYSCKSPKDFSDVDQSKINLVSAIINKYNGIFWMVSEKNLENSIMVSLGFTYPTFSLRNYAVNLKLKFFAINNNIEYSQETNHIIIYWNIPIENQRISNLNLELLNQNCKSFFEVIKKYNLFEIKKSLKKLRPSPICLKKKILKRRKF